MLTVVRRLPLRLEALALLRPPHSHGLIVPVASWEPLVCNDFRVSLGIPPSLHKSLHKSHLHLAFDITPFVYFEV